MLHKRGFTFVELVVVLTILFLLLFAVLLPLLGGSRVSHQYVYCLSNQSYIYKGMNSYAMNNDGWFPVAGVTDSSANVIGFQSEKLRGRLDVKPDDPALANNPTASLWMLVRDGSVWTDDFICRASSDKPDAMRDNFDEEITTLKETWDFAKRENLSYSMINMYHVSNMQKSSDGKNLSQWSTNVKPDWVLISDNNNADGQDIHTLNKSIDLSKTDIRKNENSRNYLGGRGQALAFGDGHVEFSRDPFAGPRGDNIFAMIKDGVDAAPTLGNSDGDAATDDEVAEYDVVLLPLNGNNGVSLSGLPGEPWRGVKREFNMYQLISIIVSLFEILFVLSFITAVVAILVRIVRFVKSKLRKSGQA